MRILLACPLLFPAFPTRAQWHSDELDHLFERFQVRLQQNPADSADLTRFTKAMAASHRTSARCPTRANTAWSGR
jgi:hypothetical protein